MSLDYPEYEEICKKSKFLGWIWRIGDVGYYFGLVGSMVWCWIMMQTLLQQLIHPKSIFLWDRFWSGFCIGTAFFFCVFWGARQLKTFALIRGRKLKGKP
jgi:hypothetical protein